MQICNLKLFVILSVVILCDTTLARRHKPDDYRLKRQFKKYLKKYNEEYHQNLTEYQHRFDIFKDSLKKIKTMNKLRQHQDSAVYGWTPFSDMSEVEFHNSILTNSDQYLSNTIQQLPLQGRPQIVLPNLKQKSLENNTAMKRDRTPIKIVQQVDWRTKGIISPIHYQGVCGACWAISVLETVESMQALKLNTTNVRELSVQQMIDCAQNSNFGCVGGDTCKLLQWLTHDHIGIETREKYPERTNAEEHVCRNVSHSSDLTFVKKYSCEDSAHQEDKLLWYLKDGPITVALNALNWQFYVGGVIQFNCDSHINNLNHAVQIVGYDLSAEIPHYIIRNSWGLRFGNAGYMKIAIGNNVCGIANQVSRIIVD